MAALTNTETTLTAIGQREDLEDMIYLVAPQETPVVSTIDKTTAKAVKHDWQTENLAAPNPNNAQLEGNDTTSFDPANNTTRLENICQIFSKNGIVSRTTDKVVLAGRDRESARQKIMKGRELKRDMEARYAGNFGSNAESGATPRGAGGMLAWMVTNSSSGTGGSSGGFTGGFVTPATPGTKRNLTETLVKAGMASVFAAGGKPTIGLMGGTLKQEWSSFTGIAEIRKDAGSGEKMATIVGAADVYVSDFGAITLVPHPYALPSDVAIIDPDMWAIAVLDGTQINPLAKTGDASKFLMTNESTLVSRNEAASVAIRDLM